MVDFATATLQNSVRVTQQMCKIMIFFQTWSMIKGENESVFDQNNSVFS